MGRAPTPKAAGHDGRGDEEDAFDEPEACQGCYEPDQDEGGDEAADEGTANRGPALSSSARGMPRMEPAMMPTTKKSRKPWPSTKFCTTETMFSGITPGTPGWRDEGAQDGRETEVPDHREQVADPDEEPAEEDGGGKADHHRVREVAREGGGEDQAREERWRGTDAGILPP